MSELNDALAILGEEMPITLAPVGTATLSRDANGASTLTVSGVCPFVYLRVEILNQPTSGAVVVN